MPEFPICIVSSSSVAKVRAEREHLQRKRRKKSERKPKKNAQRDANRTPVRVGPRVLTPKLLWTKGG